MQKLGASFYCNFYDRAAARRLWESFPTTCNAILIVRNLPSQIGFEALPMEGEFLGAVLL